MEWILQFQYYSLWENTTYDYAIAFSLFIGFLIVLKIFQVVILARLKRFAKKTNTEMDDALIAYVSNIKPPFYFIIALWFSLQYIIMPGWIDTAIFFFFIIFLVYEAVRAGEKISCFAIEAYGKKHAQKHNPNQNKTLVNITKIAVRFVLWTIGLLMMLSNVGVDISSLVASLGIGGIAIALAVQNILSDIFSSFSIYLDKPFEVGDFIIIGTDSGTVQKIGLKTTRLKTLRGEELIMSNKELTSARVQNMKKLKRRREAFSFKVVYSTDTKKLEKIPRVVEEIISAIDNAEFSRCHLSQLGDVSINFETVYFLDTADYGVYMDVKQHIQIELLKRFKKDGIAFVHPKQALLVGSEK